MKIKKTLSWIFLFSGMTVSSPHAQMAGNPVGVRGQGEWTISAMGTYMNQNLSSETAVSRRIFLKSSWGITPWFDFYLMGGGAQLEMKTGKEGVINYKDKYRFVYGVGFNVSFKPTRNSFFWIWAGGHGIRFPSYGSFIEDIYIGTTSYVQRFDMKYDWREIGGNLGIILPYRSFRFYIAGVGWFLQRFDTKREYLENGSSISFLGKEKGEYRSGLWTGGVVGLEINLPQQYSISVEALFFNENNYQIMVGICQTGGSTW